MGGLLLLLLSLSLLREGAGVKRKRVELGLPGWLRWTRSEPSPGPLRNPPHTRTPNPASPQRISPS